METVGLYPRESARMYRPSPYHPARVAARATSESPGSAEAHAVIDGDDGP